jgi:hypothetical protein
VWLVGSDMVFDLAIAIANHTSLAVGIYFDLNLSLSRSIVHQAKTR